MISKYPSCLTIAGSDSSGGAGIQADLKTFMALNVYSASVITAITAQNTKKVMDVEPCSWKIIQKQLDAVLSDLNIKYIKIGMLGNKIIIKNIANYLQNKSKYKIILDPVMYSKSNFCLLEENSIEELKNTLLPLAFLITPNKKELETLLDEKISKNMSEAEIILKLQKLKCNNILIKGGHYNEQENIILDRLFTNHKIINISSQRHNKKYTHGTGCSLSSAICAYLTLGEDIVFATKKAIAFVNKGIMHGVKIGEGINPINHNFQNIK